MIQRRVATVLGMVVCAAVLSGCAVTGLGNDVIDGRMRFVVVEASGGG